MADARIDAIRARLEAALAVGAGPWTVEVWPPVEHRADAEAMVRAADGEVVVSLMGRPEYATLGANAAADIAYLLGEVDRLRDDAALGEGALAYHAERADRFEREFCGAMDDVVQLRAMVSELTEHATQLATLAKLRDRLLLAVLGGQDTEPALTAVNEAASALGWGLTVIGEGTVPVALRELVEALDARALVEMQALREMCADDGETAVVAELFVKQGDAEERVEAAWERARALVPEAAT